jgi:hypothetical protein
LTSTTRLGDKQPELGDEINMVEQTLLPDSLLPRKLRKQLESRHPTMLAAFLNKELMNGKLLAELGETARRFGLVEEADMARLNATMVLANVQRLLEEMPQVELSSIQGNLTALERKLRHSTDTNRP